MADNKLLLKRNSDEDFLAEDDPLAELARIVGFDPPPAAKASAPMQRREPAFDLEDELLKELEIYAQPVEQDVANAASAARMPVIEQEHLAEPMAEPVFAAPEVELEPASATPREPVILEAVETFTDMSEGRVYERPVSHPVFDLEDEILREFSAFDARRVTRTEEQPVEADIVHQAPLQDDIVPAELHDVPDIRTTTAAPNLREQGRHIYDSFRDDDLDDAISNALAPRRQEETATAKGAADQPTAIEEQVAHFADESVPASQPVDDGYWADLDAGDIAAPEVGFEAAADIAVRAEDAEPVQAVFAEPSIDSYVESVADDPVSQDFADVIPMMRVAPAASEIQSAPTAVAGHRPEADDDYGLDALLAEVERYPVGDGSGRWGVQSMPVAAEVVARAAPPLVQDFVPFAAETTTAPIEALPSAAATVEHQGDAAFEDGNFDIDLGDIEFDLSDLNEGAIDASPDLLAELADAPVAEEPAFRPAHARSADADYSSLPFDPSQIAQEEETFEAIAEMDVPDVPVVHEEEKPAPHPEYDIDLDAEMAQLFATATSQPAAVPRPGPGNDGPANAAGAQNRTQSASLDLDEFERALEEDFRRSFAENRTASHPDRVALAPVYAEPPQGRSRRGMLLLASAAVAVVLFGGAGVYAYMSGDTKILTSSEPKVILADTDPVKVVPDDPGGKQVPNQNKAVYDRVSGAKVDEAKQESLVTSNEEPVDVVQRTLMPETLPMDDDSMAMATPTGDTIDPRLLPDDEEKDRVTTTSKVVSGVSPRKVKTMVVRPDGSLVEREVTEEDLKQQAANDAELMKIAQKAAQDAATANDSQTDDIAKAIENVPERLAPNDVTPAETVDAKSVQTEEIKPTPAADTELAAVEPVQPVEITDEQPAVAEQPADTAEVKPADAAVEAKPAEAVVEAKPAEADAKPVEAAVAEKPAERSIAVDSQQVVVVDEEAAAKVAAAEVPAEQVEDAPVRKVKTTKITPVPEVRPVDQPVTVVGTVTDQGTVRTDAEAKPQEVALADATPQTTVAAGSYVIQIASLPSEAEAQTSYSRLSAKFAGIIGGRGVDIRKAQIKNKGTYYRVRIPAGSKQEAQALCSDYKKAGGSCLVSK
jgi:hypothetical protein